MIDFQQISGDSILYYFLQGKNFPPEIRLLSVFFSYAIYIIFWTVLTSVCSRDTFVPHEIVKNKEDDNIKVSNVHFIKCTIKTRSYYIRNKKMLQFCSSIDFTDFQSCSIVLTENDENLKYHQISQMFKTNPNFLSNKISIISLWKI